MDISTIPDWIGTAIVGVITGIIGYLFKSYLDQRKRNKEKKQEEEQRLLQLRGLFQQTGSLFEDQSKLVRRLWVLIGKRVGPNFQTGLGFDEDLYRAYDTFTEEESELHSIIRSTTTNSQRLANERVSEWLTTDNTYKMYKEEVPERVELAQKLLKLERHLSLWHDKCKSVLHDPKRSLVYLGDEKKHGEPFPSGIEDTLDKVIEGLNK